MTRKWNFAPAARRKANAAMATLEHAKAHLANTHDAADVWGDDPAFRDAFGMLDQASRAVARWEDEQHAAAKGKYEYR